MGTMTFIPIYKRTRWPVRKEKLDGKLYSVINNINFLILELIIRNTLNYNKLTSADEIYENLTVCKNATFTGLDIEIEIDVDSIISICDALCSNKGVLIKLKKNDECFYKLNYQENV